MTAFLLALAVAVPLAFLAAVGAGTLLEWWLRS